MVGGLEYDLHHFRLIISPEHGDRISDLKTYVLWVMAHVAAVFIKPDLIWRATCHSDTDQPHAHVQVRGERGMAGIWSFRPSPSRHGAGAS
jgi:type IV secretory pathway VirD2 relaxase